jgi:Tc5 transposase DNA-binding domain
MRKSLQKWSDDGVGITDQLIRQRALSIAESFHITTDRFKGSSGWVENFKHRHNIRRGEWLKANKMLPPDFTNHMSHSSAVPPTPVLMAYDQRLHMQGSESQSSNCLSKPTRSHEDQYQDQEHVHGRLSATTAHWPEPMHNDVQQSPHATSNSTMIDPVLQTQSPMSPMESDHPLTHSLQDIQHSPEILPQHLHHHNQHQHNQQQHHHNQQPQAVVYSTYGQTLCGPGVPHLSPTLAQAEEAINILITFLDTNGRGIIKDDERAKLIDIKCALFQAASGVPYERSAN